MVTITKTAEKLDSVLKYLNRVYDENMQSNSFPKDDLIYKTKSEISMGILFKAGEKEFDGKVLKSNEIKNIIDLGLVLEYLVKREMIKITGQVYPYKYSIAFEGINILNSGGFSGENNRKMRQRVYEFIKDSLLILAGFLAGIGTILLFSVEVYKLRHSIH